MKVLVVGGGGREHALCWALSASPLCDRLYCAPGNAGIAGVATCVDIAADDVDRLVAWAVQADIAFVVVGPEAALVAGLVDRLEAEDIKAFGPTAAAAMLEGSKGFMKALCARAGIPTAAFARFTDADAAKAHVRAHGVPVVVKVDGLAAGKGVTVAHTVAEAEGAIDAALVDRTFGAAGTELVIEDCLDGEEISFFALCDGRTAVPLASAQDHKPVGDGDTGPNTGGMGAYSPAPLMTDDLQAEVMARIIRPTVAAMADAGMPFKGVLFAGLMITADGPMLLEFNCRFGDPECQVLMMRLMSDLLPALVAARDGVLESFDLRWYPDTALCVVMAANGYPGPVRTGTEIRGLDGFDPDDPDLMVFHAGTRAADTRADDGRVLAAGGRVLGVTAMAPALAEAQRAAYAAVDQIDWPDGFCRRDIGWRALAPRH